MDRLCNFRNNFIRVLCNNGDDASKNDREKREENKELKIKVNSKELESNVFSEDREDGLSKRESQPRSGD